jgi:hypothetical protein
MYKRILHQITEEHFDRPMASTFEPTSAVQLRASVRNAFGILSMRVRSYLNLNTMSTDEQTAIDIQLAKDLSKITDIINTYYGINASTEFDSKMQAYVTNTIELIRAIGLKADTTNILNRRTLVITELATLLTGLNAAQWPTSAVADLLTKISDAWAAQATARNDKDWVADQMAFDQAYSLFVSGEANSPGFADVLVRGIIQQFPDLFKI